MLNDSFGVEVLNWRVRVSSPSTDIWFGAGEDSDATFETTRHVWDASSQSFVETPVHRQSAMESGASFEGPLIVEQRETTAVVGTGDFAHIDAHGNLVIRIGR